MSTSGSYNFFIKRNELIKASMRAIRVLRAGMEPTADQVNDFSEALNLMLKQWQGRPDFARGLKIFSRKRLYLFLAKGQQRYLVGPGGGDSKATENYGRTTLSADATGGNTLLSIAANSDSDTFPGETVTMANGDFVGVVLNDGTLHWSTIVTSTSSSVTIADALPSDASEGKYVYWFTTKAQSPIELEYASLRDEEYKDSPLFIYRDVADYEILPDKYAVADPTCVLFEPLLVNAAITLDSRPEDVTKIVRLVAIYPAEDMDTTNDEFGFPQVWHNAIKWGLAKQIAPECGAGLWLPEHEDNFVTALAIAQAANPETTDIYFQPDA